MEQSIDRESYMACLRVLYLAIRLYDRCLVVVAVYSLGKTSLEFGLAMLHSKPKLAPYGKFGGNSVSDALFSTDERLVFILV